jgi:UDP-N-acetylglucosamine 4-epimerase
MIVKFPKVSIHDICFLPFFLKNPHAAVIPLFMKAAMEGISPNINGDGTNSRDFTFVQNALQANIKAMLDTEGLTKHEVVNIAVGDRTNLVELWDAIASASGTHVQPTFGPPRAGDIPHSLASIEKAKELFGYDPQFRLRDGIKITFDCFKEEYGRGDKC